MTPAIARLRAAGVWHRVLPYEHDPSAGSFGVEAASALGLDPAHVFKTLVVESDDGRFAVALVPADRRLDPKPFADAVGARRVKLCDPAEAERITGYVVGAISPIGQRRWLPTVIDQSIESVPVVHVSAGRRGLQVALEPDDLVRLTRATTARIAR